MQEKKMELNQEERQATLAMMEDWRKKGYREAEEKRREQQIDVALAKISPRFRGKTFADFTTQSTQQQQVKRMAERYIATFTDRLQESSSVIFSGKTGTGKTLLAAIQYQELAKAGFSVEYQPSLHFLRLLRDKQFESHAAFAPLFAYYEHLHFLIIDEVTEGCGKEAYPADWERHLLRTLIDTRYHAKRCTLIISNRNKEEMIMRLGEPTMDRLAEDGITLAFNWNSYRQK